MTDGEEGGKKIEYLDTGKTDGPESDKIDAIIGLEHMGGIMVYDISKCAACILFAVFSSWLHLAGF